jgi:hypothetical protein
MSSKAPGRWSGTPLNGFDRSPWLGTEIRPQSCLSHKFASKCCLRGKGCHQKWACTGNYSQFRARPGSYGAGRRSVSWIGIQKHAFIKDYNDINPLFNWKTALQP